FFFVCLFFFFFFFFFFYVVIVDADGNAETTVKNIAFNYIVRLA
ncbi:side tail fiber protein, partial [Salmonella enterica subsp. enterica serovar Newport str. SHSN010]